MSLSCAASLPIFLIGYGVFLVSFACANWVEFNAADGTRYAYGLWWNCTTETNFFGNGTVHECRFYDIDLLDG
jgi:hypothetical protein